MYSKTIYLQNKRLFINFFVIENAIHKMVVFLHYFNYLHANIVNLAKQSLV